MSTDYAVSRSYRQLSVFAGRNMVASCQKFAFHLCIFILFALAQDI
jgi:hypothetical protein